MKKIVGTILLALILTGCAKSKTGFVDTQKLLEDYQEMKDVQEKYNLMSENLRGELEPKIQSYQIKLDLYQKNVGSMSAAERQEKEEELMALRQQIQQDQQMRGGQLQQESEVALDSVITKVKDFIKDYGKKNGYDYIYGQNEAGSILYGKEENDLTSEVVTKLNESYKPNSTEETSASQGTEEK